MYSSHEQPSISAGAGWDPLQAVRLGGSAVNVGRFGLGTAFVGIAAAQGRADEALDAIRAALRAGVRYFDTAPLYGLGHAERLLGQALAGQTRGSFTVSTKVGRHPATDAGGKQVSVFDFSAAATMRSLEQSLARLQLDRVDIVLVHDPDDHYHEALTGAYPVLQRLRSEGVVGAIGVGVNDASLAARVIRDADPDCVLVAGRYTLLDQRAADEVLPLCAERGVAVLAGGVFNGGILAAPRPGAWYDYVPAPLEVLRRARRLQRLCARHGVPLRAAALQFPLGHRAVASVVCGCQRPEEVEDTLDMFKVPVPSEFWQDLISEGLLSAADPLPGSPGALRGD